MRRRARRRFASVALVTSPLGIAAVGATQLAARHPARLASDFAQPLVVATAWGAYGGAAFALLAAGVLGSVALVGVALARIARDPQPIDRPAIFAASAIGIACALAWPFVFSSDPYAYAAYAALAERGLDPYLPAPATLHDAFLDRARWQWQGPIPVDIYGPLELAATRAAVRVGGGFGVGATLAILRASTALAFLASVVVFDLASRGRLRARRSFVVAAYALNPVAIWGAAEGHNDAYVALGLAIAAYLASRGRSRTGALLAGLLPLLKATGVAFALGYAFEAWRTKRRAGPGTLAAVAAGLALSAALGLPPLLRALGTVRAHGRYEPSLSAQGLVGLLPALLCALAAGAWGGRKLASGDPRGYAWLGIAALLALPNAYPWYALWLVPFALAAGGGPAAIALWLATIAGLVRYLPDASGTFVGPAAAFAAVIAIAPLGIALAELGPLAWHRKDSS